MIFRKSVILGLNHLSCGLLPGRRPSLTYLTLGVMRSLTPGTSCRFPVTNAGWADDILRCTYYFCNAYSS